MYQNAWKLGYVDEYAGIIGTVTNDYWFFVLKIKDGNHKCEVKQTDAGAATLTTCGSCGINGTQDDDFIVSGAWDGSLQLLTYKRDCSTYRSDV